MVEMQSNIRTIKADDIEGNEGAFPFRDFGIRFGEQVEDWNRRVTAGKTDVLQSKLLKEEGDLLRAMNVELNTIRELYVGDLQNQLYVGRLFQIVQTLNEASRLMLCGQRFNVCKRREVETIGSANFPRDKL